MNPTTMADEEAVDPWPAGATAELSRRPARAPDFAAENRVLVALARTLADEPESLLQQLAETALALCRADSAGISVWEEDGRRCRWPALAGRWAALGEDQMPSALGAGGPLQDCGAAQWLSHPERQLPALAAVSPRIEEALVMPFGVNGAAAGTLWVAVHDPTGRFDAEDRRVLTSLGAFAAAACRPWLSRRGEDEEGPEGPAAVGAALREDEARLRAVFQSTAIGMAVLTQAARFVQVNQAFCILTGYSSEELRALDCAALTHPDDIASQQALLEELLAGRRSSFIIEKRYRRKDGTLVWVQNDVSLVRDAAGQPLYLVALCQNVTQRQRAREALRASEQRYRELVLALPAAIYTTDAAGRITLYNEAAAELWGRRPEIGRDLWCGSLRIYRLDGAALPHEACPMAIALREGRFTRGDEIVIERPDGTRRCALSYPHPLRDAAGAVVGAMNMLVDVTDLRESEERFRTLADNMSQLAWMADGEGWLFWYNRRWFEYTGTTLEEMQGWGWKAVHHPDHVDRVVEKISRHWQSGEVWEDTFPLRGADGDYRWFLSRAVPIRDEAGHVTRWFGTNTDITEQLAAEQALKDADRRKDEFLAMLAHELRNPLAPISNAVQVMRLKSLEDPQLIRARDVIERQVGQMSRLVGDLLDVSRITRGKIKLEPQLLDLNEVAAQAVESAQSLIDQRGHRLAVSLSPAPLRVAGDPTRLAQVVTNLLNNAVKFTDPGGRIDLCCERDGEAARLAVRDTGIGIAPELLPHVFDLFTQADQSLDRAQGGLGIGLSLVYRLVQLHGGTITAASAGAGQGSEFVIRLPLLGR